MRRCPYYLRVRLSHFVCQLLSCIHSTNLMRSSDLVLDAQGTDSFIPNNQQILLLFDTHQRLVLLAPGSGHTCFFALCLTSGSLSSQLPLSPPQTLPPLLQCSIDPPWPLMNIFFMGNPDSSYRSNVHIIQMTPKSLMSNSEVSTKLNLILLTICWKSGILQLYQITVHKRKPTSFLPKSALLKNFSCNMLPDNHN